MSAKTSRGGASRSGCAIRRSSGSSHPVTSRTGSTGTTTSPRTKTRSPGAARPTRPGSSCRRTKSGSATLPYRASWSRRSRPSICDSPSRRSTCRGSLLPFLLGAVGERQLLRRVLEAIREVRHQAGIREIQWMRLFLVALGDGVQPVHDRGIAHFDRELAPAVEASGRKVDGPHDGVDAIGEEHLAVQLQPLELADLDPDIVENPQAAHTLDQLVFFQCMRWARHHVDLDAAPGRANQPLQNHGILIPLVLNEQRMPRFVDELRDAVPAVDGAPQQVRAAARLEWLPVPIRLEARHDLSDFVPVIRDHRVVPGPGKVLRLPIERFDERRVAVDDHRLLVRERQGRVAVDYVDPRPRELLACPLVVILTA